jgi:peptidyl-prolyl cis-trans isomerase B (cyclophilin B)
MIKRTLQILLMFTFIVVLAACGTDEDNSNTGTEANVDYAKEVTENPIATITMDSGEKIVIELEPKTAPNTVANFIHLVEDGFYDGVIFHRVIPGFMIQGGDPEGTGTGGPGYEIAGEFTDNGFTNDLKHTRGVISMARTQDPNSAGSQFFIMHEDDADLDNQYAAFGKVLEGIEVVDRIANVKRDGSNKPLTDEVIQSITVDTKGFDYPEPVKQ